MGMIVLVIFLGVFAVAALLLYRQRHRRRRSRPSKCWPRLTRPWPPKARRCASRSSICARTSSSARFPGSTAGSPSFDLGPSSRPLLHQANLKWTAGGLLAMCGACFALPAFIIHWKFGNSLIAAAVGLAFASSPSASCSSSAAAGSRPSRRNCLGTAT